MAVTVKDFINAKLTLWNASYNDELLEALFTVHGVDGNAEYNKDTRRMANLILYYIIPDIVAGRPKSVSEGGYSISYDLDALLRAYNMLCIDLGLENKLSNKAKVKDITRRW